MCELNNETNIVEALRAKTEQEDMNKCLKRTLSGYSKKSVLEYLSVLRKQQQTMADTFSRNQQALFEEKESLRKSCDALKTKLSQVESEYHNLFEELKINDLGNEEVSISDIAALKNKITVLEDELEKSNIEKSQLNQQIQQQKIFISDLNLKLEQSEQEKTSIKEMLKAELLETKKQRSIAAKLSGTVEEKCEEIKFLNSLLSEGQLASMTAKVNELTEQLAQQAEVMAKCNDEIDLKSQTIETLTNDNDTAKKNLSDLSKVIDELREQNDKLMLVNTTLTGQLELAYKNTIELIKEKSDISMDKLTAFRKLDDANSKIIMLELKLKNQDSSC